MLASIKISYRVYLNIVHFFHIVCCLKFVTSVTASDQCTPCFCHRIALILRMRIVECIEFSRDIVLMFCESYES